MSLDEQLVPIGGSSPDERGFALVRRQQKAILLTLSLEVDGDVQVSLNHGECAALIDALTSALKKQ